VLLAAALLVALVAPGCRTVRKLTGSGSGSASSSGISAEEIRERLVAYSGVFSLAISEAADRVASESGDPEVRRNAIQLKLGVIPLVRRFAFLEEPRTAVLAIWAVDLQTIFHLSEGEGGDAFGDYQDVVLETARSLEEEIERIAASFIPEDELAKTRDEIREFARAHPMGTQFTVDPTQLAVTLEDLRGSFLSVLEIPLSPFRGLRGIDEGAQAIREVSDMGRRLTAVVEDLPDRVRWQTELLLVDLDRNSAIDSALGSLETFSRSSAELAATADALPAELREEVTATLEAASPTIDEARSAVEEASAAVREARAATEQVREAADLARTTVAEAREAIEDVEALLDPGQEALAAFTEAGRAWDATLRTFGETIRLLSEDEDRSGGGDERPPAEPAQEPEPFEIEDWTRATRSATGMAVELRALLDEFRALVKDEEVAERVGTATRSTIEETQSATRAIVAAVTWRALLVVAALLVAALAYRWITVRFLPRRS